MTKVSKKVVAKPGELLDKENLETWHLGGRKILVGFAPVPKENFDSAEKAFWDDVNEYIEATRKKRCLIANKKGELIRCPKCNDCSKCEDYESAKNIYTCTVSLDKMIDDCDEEDVDGWDPTGTTALENTAAALDMIADLIADIAEQDAVSGQVVKLLAKGFQKNEIIEIADIQKGKSAAYAFIEKTQKLAKKIYKKHYK